jgi:hypothetical protein
VIVVGIAVLTSCGTSIGYQQNATGKSERVGGPAPGLAVPLPGTITARSASGQTFTATAAANGRFKLLLPPGRYHVTGRSPQIQSGQMICDATAGLRVTRDKPPRPVIVVCSIK